MLGESAKPNDKLSGSPHLGVSEDVFGTGQSTALLEMGVQYYS
jgi:hypothetical protein